MMRQGTMRDMHVVTMYLPPLDLDVYAMLWANRS
jgi:hypothetical protein